MSLKLVRKICARNITSSSIAGYGKLKGQTFRLSNMGDETEETVSHLLACLDDCLCNLDPASNARL